MTHGESSISIVFAPATMKGAQTMSHDQNLRIKDRASYSRHSPSSLLQMIE